MKKGICVVVALLALAGVADDKAAEMVKIGGEGSLVFVNVAGVNEAPLSKTAATLSGFLMIDVAVRKGAWTLSSVKQEMDKAKATAAVFVVKDASLPISLVAMEEKWGVVNVEGLSEKALEKEALRVASVVIGGASSKYQASVLRPAFSAKDIEEKAGEQLTIDSLMAIFPNLETYGFKRYETLTYRDALEEGVAPAPVNEVQRKIKEEFEKNKGK